MGLLETFFRSLPRTFLTLLMSISGGVSWSEVVEVLFDVGNAYAMLFVLYTAIMILALMNIVTGIFVNDAFEMGQLDHELRTHLELQKKEDGRRVAGNLCKTGYRPLWNDLS